MVLSKYCIKKPDFIPKMLPKSDKKFDTYSEPSYGSFIIIKKIKSL